MAKVLILDDEQELLELYGEILSGAGHEVFMASTCAEAKSVVESRAGLDVALLDRMIRGTEGGFEVLRFVQSEQPNCTVLLISAYPDFRSASEALRCGAFDYLTKPIAPEALRHAVDCAAQVKKLRQETILAAEENKRHYDELKSKQEILQHDMRSLLVGILGFANLLINRTTLDTVQMEYCKQIQHCGVQLENMVNSYLDVSNLEQESFRLRKSRFNLLDVIKQSRKTLHFLADEKNVEISIIYNRRLLSIDDVIVFRGDRLYLQNAIDNLLKNAIEASPTDKRVKIRIKHTRTRLLLSVHNWGSVPTEIRDVFFEKYATHGKKNGLGLGTYMIRLVAEAHSGRASVRSSDDQGTEVTLLLPMNGTPISQDAQDGQSDPSAKAASL